MRKIEPGQILVFSIFLALAAAAGIGTTWLLIGRAPLGDFRGVALTAASVVLVYGFGILLYRILLAIAPLREGEIPEGSQQEFVYHVYLLFYLMLFHPVMRSSLVPVPLLRLFYLALGARMGTNSYTGGIMFDPPFIRIGDNTLVGQTTLLVPHVIEGSRLAHYPIRIGSNVTIGAHAVVLSGVTIGDGAIVATGAVVAKGTRIGEGETWGGVPAHPIKRDVAGNPLGGLRTTDR